MFQRLANAQLIFVTGKGGVGKSVCSAALAFAFAERGETVLLVETDTYSAFTKANDDPTKIRTEEIRKGVYCVNLRAEACLNETLKRFLPSARIVKTITGNRVTKAFFDSAPSVNEFVLLDQIDVQLQNERPRYDRVIVDLPATGHALTFLSVPRTLASMMRNKGPFAKRAMELDKKIVDAKTTKIVAVCLPEEMPVNETIDLANQMKTALGRGIDCVIANMVHHPPTQNPLQADEPEATKIFAEMGPDEKVIAGTLLAQSWARRDNEYLDILVDGVDVPVFEIPIAYETEDLKIVDHVASTFTAGNNQVEAAAAS